MLNAYCPRGIAQVYEPIDGKDSDLCPRGTSKNSTLQRDWLLYVAEQGVTQGFDQLT